MTRVIDLSHGLVAGKERFKLEVKKFSVDEYIKEYNVPEGEWYIMEEIEICTHTGTHVESPYHAMKDGNDVVNIDIKRFIGEAAVVDFSDKKYNEAITKAEIIEKSKHIKPYDIVLIRTGLSKFYGTPEYKRPYIEEDVIEWLIEMNINCLGIDCSGIENRAIDSHQVNHKKLFKNGIPLIEDMNNLTEIKGDRVFFMAMPLPIKGLDASQLRPLAIEPIEVGRKLSEVFLNPEAEWCGFKK